MVAGQLNKLYGTKIEAVHYKGEAPMWLDLAGGQIQGAIGSVAAMLPHVQKGSVRPVAVPTRVRSPKLPEVPTFFEQGFTEPVFGHGQGRIRICAKAVGKQRQGLNGSVQSRLAGFTVLAQKIRRDRRAALCLGQRRTLGRGL